jgi:DNA-binding HxlR family transcriptional regulator
MHKADLSELPCSLARSLQVVGEWWTLLVLRDLCSGWNRFDEIHEHLGIARNILKARLDSLIENGMAYRRPYCERPARYEYLPTEKGLDFVPAMLAIVAWGDRWTSQGRPPMLFTHLSCGRDTTAAVVCSACGAPLAPGDIDSRPAAVTQ